MRRIWIISDTHFGHNQMVEYCGRPINFPEKIEKNLQRMVAGGDIIIHLGDFCIGNDNEWHERIVRSIPAKWILCRGNHDHKGNLWYWDNGWDMVCERFQLIRRKKKICFSHIPQEKHDFDINIYGHFHNNTHRSCEPQLIERLKDDVGRYCFVLEHHYQPLLLDTILDKVGVK